jgi:small-conductance mechanosensitive channel
MVLEDFIQTLFGSNIYNTPPPTNSLMYNYFLPFIIIWVIFFGILEALPIFKRTKINLLLSVAMTLMITATPYWFLLAQFMSQWGAYTAVIVFVVVFVFGVIAWAFGRGREYAYEAGVEGENINPIGKAWDRRRLDKLIEKKNEMLHRYSKLNPDKPEAKALYEKIELIDKEIKQLKAKLGLH